MLNRKKKVKEPIATGCDPDKSGQAATRADSINGACKQKKIIHHFLLSLFIFTASSSYAQRILTVEEAVANALQKNYDIILSRNDSTIAAIDYSYKNAVFLPQLNATVEHFGTIIRRNKPWLMAATETKAG